MTAQLAIACLLLAAGVPAAAFGGWLIVAMSGVVLAAAFAYGPKLAAAISLAAQNMQLRASQAHSSFASVVAASIHGLSLSTARAALLGMSYTPARTRRITDAVRTRIHACAVTLAPRITPAPRIRRARLAAA